MNRRAYTLVEVVLATAILAVVLLGAQSAIVIASRAIPSPTGGPAAVVSAGGALGTMADDVTVATAFATASATDIRFTVPDRTGDGLDDTIRYTWSGIAGDPLQRTVNGGQAAVVAPAVQDFALAYDTTQVALPTTYSDSAETALFTFAPPSPSGVGTVTSAKWWAQYFQPTLPGSARSWSVTRVTFVATKNSNSTGQAKAQLRVNAAGVPGSQVLGETMILESGMSSSWATVTAPYGYVSGLTPGQGLWFVFQWVADTEAFDFQYKNGTGSSVGAPLDTSINNGGSWSNVATSVMVMTVYGKVSTPDATQYRTAISGVRCRLRSGTSAISTVSQTWRILNLPQMPGT